MQAYYNGNICKNFINSNAHVFGFSVIRKIIWVFEI